MTSRQQKINRMRKTEDSEIHARASAHASLRKAQRCRHDPARGPSYSLDRIAPWKDLAHALKMASPGRQSMHAFCGQQITESLRRRQRVFDGLIPSCTITASITDSYFDKISHYQVNVAARYQITGFWDYPARRSFRILCSCDWVHSLKG